MYNSQEEFAAAADSARPQYEAAGIAVINGKDAFSEEGVEVAWNVYYAAVLASRQEDDRGLIIGGLRTEGDPAHQGAGIDESVKKNFKTMNEATRESGQGGVLSSENWSFLVNDSWILGGVHIGAPFFLASPRTEENVYKASDQKFRVFGRELVGLTSFGYAFEHGPWPQLGEVAVYQGGPYCDSADFSQYQESVDRFEKNGRWRALLE